MKSAEALALLGFGPGTTFLAPEVVRAAYAAAVKAEHPDHGGEGTRLQLLKDARDTLLCPSDIGSCKLCRGAGKVRGRFGAQACTACKGTGDQR